MIQFSANKRRAVCTADEPITSGSVGLPVRFVFSPEWEGLDCVAVFEGSGQRVDVLLGDGCCTVPPEVLTEPGSLLRIGVFGADSLGGLAMTTVYAEAGLIRRGAEPGGVEPGPRTQSLLEQAVAAAGSAAAIAQSLRDDAEAGTFDGMNAYELAVENGFVGTEAQWLQSLRGQDAAVDATLSNAGEAADAAAAGAGIGAARHTADYALRFAETLNSGAGIPLDAAWERGGIGTYGNEENTRTYRARTKNKLSYPVDIVLRAAGGYRFQLATYRQDGTFVDITDGKTSRSVSAGTVFRVVAKAYPEDTSVTADPDVFGAAISIENNIGPGGAPDLSGYATESWVGQQGFLTAHQDISGKLDADQGAANAGKFLVVGNDGGVVPVTMSAWQGGSY